MFLRFNHILMDLIFLIYETDFPATVDERNVVQKSLEEAKNNYIEKYNLYLDAKEALLKAESDSMKYIGN